MPRIPQEIPTLWYENEDGVRWLPDLRDAYQGRPEGFDYQRSRFPRQLNESILRIINQADVDACSHSDVHATGGWVEGVEGQECRACRGTRTREVGQPWGHFQGGRSVDLGGGSMSGPVELMQAMSRPTWRERLKSLWRTWHWMPTHTLENAVLATCVSCERCLNILLWEYGCNDGYPAHSEQARRCGTECEFCHPPAYSDAEPAPSPPSAPGVEPEPQPDPPPGPSIWERLEPQSPNDLDHLSRRDGVAGTVAADDLSRLAVDRLP